MPRKEPEMERGEKGRRVGENLESQTGSSWFRPVDVPLLNGMGHVSKVVPCDGAIGRAGSNGKSDHGVTSEGTVELQHLLSALCLVV